MKMKYESFAEGGKRGKVPCLYDFNAFHLAEIGA
jgi:hypothetical protein